MAAPVATATLSATLMPSQAAVANAPQVCVIMLHEIPVCGGHDGVVGASSCFTSPDGARQCDPKEDVKDAGGVSDGEVTDLKTGRTGCGADAAWVCSVSGSVEESCDHCPAATRSCRSPTGGLRCRLALRLRGFGGAVIVEPLGQQCFRCEPRVLKPLANFRDQ